ncbi:SIS domain-containing protein [uncultured Friedmanniella sp.]|uniref:SIS domain-containing protein n=1 Tax=uncultured Friedmanniella sp. TaxID=335381 RepID=UPI0035CAB146
MPEGAALTQMAREIAEQPAAIAQTLDTLLPQRSEITALARGRRRLLLIARGSSDNAATYGRYLAEVHAGMAGALAAPSVATLYAAKLDLSDTVTIAVSQSGATAEIVETLAWAKECGAATVAVTNVAGSPLALGADVALVTQAGPELAVPATKTYTTQVAALAVAVDALAPVPGRLDAEFAAVAAEAEQMLLPDDALDAMVDRLAGTEEVLASGRGLAFGTMLEVALKLEETCLRPVRGLSYADLKHGPIAIVDASLVTLLVAGPSGPTLPGLVDLAATVRAAGSPVLGIGGDASFRAACDLAMPGPALSELLAPLALVIPGQLLVERLARRLGLDPDAPRGLKKVTQTD